MLGENKNLKDSTIDNSNVALKDNSATISYTKTNKLITALFMVTDIMDKEEPLRNKLRILGMNVISDIHKNPSDSEQKIAEILAFLDIGSSVRMLSEMNSNILKKEFGELHRSVKEFILKKNPIWLEEFMKEDDTLSQVLLPREEINKNPIGHIGHTMPTRIGVQKGSTLMNALSKVEGKTLSNRVPSLSFTKHFHTSTSSPVHSTNLNYDILKQKRRDEIVSIIKNKLSVVPDSGGATITDIKNSAEGPLVSCGEKTLQRELVSMVHDGVLHKTGEKRWSKYSL